MDRTVFVIIPAAGHGVRALTDVPKQFSRLGESTVLEATVSQFVRIPEVAGVIVALPPSGIPGRVGLTAEEIQSLGRPGAPVSTVAGGPTRQESVMNALSSLPHGAKWVAVHDAVRPYFSQSLFRRVFEACVEHGAAIPGLGPPDTVKRLSVDSEMLVEETLDRRSLVMAQTPQVFDRETLVEAHIRAREDGFEGTDDSQLVERLGIPVAVVPGERSNIKLTYPEDFAKAKPDYPSGRQTVTGLGFDVHPLGEGRKCVIGGVAIPFDKGLLGYSDADVLTHAVIDAILGALSEGDIGHWFPPGDERYRDACSIGLLESVWTRFRDKAEVIHLDAVVVAEAPKIAPFSREMRVNIAAALGISPERVSIKATTSERMGFTGRGEGIAAFCTATLQRELG